MEHRRCAACEQAFRPRAQSRGQLYCGQAACQRERRGRWQRNKRRRDEDYRANQARAQRVWAADHRDYWRKWRAAHPEYTERTRLAHVGAMARSRCHVLQRWTHHRRFLPLHQGHTGWFRGRVAMLQRRMRGRSN